MIIIASYLFIPGISGKLINKTREKNCPSMKIFPPKVIVGYIGDYFEDSVDIYPYLRKVSDNVITEAYAARLIEQILFKEFDSWDAALKRIKEIV